MGKKGRNKVARIRSSASSACTHSFASSSSFSSLLLPSPSREHGVPETLASGVYAAQLNGTTRCSSDLDHGA